MATEANQKENHRNSKPSAVRRPPSALSALWKIIASGFGSGYAPLAPGTAGAMVGCLILWLLHCALPSFFFGENAWIGLALLILIFFFLGVKSADEMEAEWGHDPAKVVVDEMVGVWIAMLFVPFTFQNLLIAFVLFRIFDIWKPLGIRRMEKMKGGWGVMMDDVLAGVYALVVLQGILFLINDLK
ncbi:MAG: phosphatidylglycerophosphatase A [Bacteroidota bacterium]